MRLYVSLYSWGRVLPNYGFPKLGGKGMQATHASKLSPLFKSPIRDIKTTLLKKEPTLNKVPSPRRQTHMEEEKRHQPGI